MHCSDCSHWVIARTTLYQDGSSVDTFRAADGSGRCGELHIDTAPSFGCMAFAAGDGHVVYSHKLGAPWQHSHAGPCPDCNAAGHQGSTACHRCAGTGKVRHYDDGYIGEEQSRLHPKEKANREPPQCPHCAKRIDLEWIACPHCGKRLDRPMPTEIISFEIAS
jgi:hypothetical protein